MYIFHNIDHHICDTFHWVFLSLLVFCHAQFWHRAEKGTLPSQLHLKRGFCASTLLRSASVRWWMWHQVSAAKISVNLSGNSYIFTLMQLLFFRFRRCSGVPLAVSCNTEFICATFFKLWCFLKFIWIVHSVIRKRTRVCFALWYAIYSGIIRPVCGTCLVLKPGICFEF